MTSNNIECEYCDKDDFDSNDKLDFHMLTAHPNETGGSDLNMDEEIDESEYEKGRYSKGESFGYE